MTVSPGTRLGPYEIVSLLGSGGMGEVYKARDTRLDRTVAIKILPAHLANDADFRERFEREARTLSQLNHPHICTLHDVGEVPAPTPDPRSPTPDTVRFLVMEYLEGETLADQLKSGKLPIEQALEVATQIGDALDKAHRHGVVHRDLKPSNIFLVSSKGARASLGVTALADSGPESETVVASAPGPATERRTRADQKVVAKLLDFGLAKLRPQGQSPMAGVSAVATGTVPLTGQGTILGTLQYMAPEQLEGREADAQSDLFAFGAVLYEMVTGKRAFEGKSPASIIGAILERDPAPVTRLQPLASSALASVIAQCLRKDPENRWGCAHDLLKELKAVTIGRVEQTAQAAQVTAPPRPLWRRALPMAASTIVIGVLTAVAAWSLKPTPRLTIARFPITLAEGQQFTNIGRQVVAISPDGTRVVYVANERLFIRSMSELEARAIPGTETLAARNPVFSPDGGSIAFWSNGDQTLKRITVSGGAAVTICQADNPFGLSWNEGWIVFGQGSKGIMRVSATGGKPELVASVKSSEQAHGPQILPDGQTVLFTLASGTGADRWDRAEVVVHSLRSGERRIVIQGGSDARYLPSGHIVYALRGVVFAVPFDVRRLETTGGPVPVVEGVRRATVNATGSAQFAISGNGSLAYIPGPVSTSSSQLDLALFDRQGQSQPLKLVPGPYQFPRVSPDGKRVAYQTDDGKEASIWIYDLSTARAPRRLTFGGNNRFPVWAADSQRVAFQSDREGDLAIFWQRADGTGTADRLTKPEKETAHIPNSWAPTAERFLFDVATRSTISLWTFSLADQKATAFDAVQSITPSDAVFSPDGRWVAYTSFQAGRERLYVEPFPPSGAKYQISEAGGHDPIWSPDGKELFFNLSSPGRSAVVSITAQPSFTFGNPVSVPRGGRTEFPPNVPGRNSDITPDGKRFVGVIDAGLISSANVATPQIHVVLNWFEELKQRVPIK